MNKRHQDYRLVCIVNNYNYDKYLRVCLDSALTQTIPFERVIVVDDGSQDNSRAIIESYANTHPNLLPIFKQNAGQLSCFNAAAPYIEEADLVFFLDADDIYPHDYVENILAAISTERADFYYCKAQQFTDDKDSPVTSYLDAGEPIVLPVSSALTLATRRWLGAQTSALVIRGGLYRQILPYQCEHDWVVRADDVLVYAASILGARKVRLRSIRIGYRVHGNNLFMGNLDWKTTQAKKLHAMKVDRLFDYFCHKAGVRCTPGYVDVVRELARLDTETKRLCRLPRLSKILPRLLHRRIIRSIKGLPA